MTITVQGADELYKWRLENPISSDVLWIFHDNDEVKFTCDNNTLLDEVITWVQKSGILYWPSE